MRNVILLLALAVPAFANGIVVPRGATRTPLPPVRLSRQRVTAELADRAAHVTVRQTFQNTTNRVLEGTYLFPLPRGASVSEFAMTMGGKMVKGEILEAGKARSIYESIVRRRRDPGLLEYCGRNLYRARVFPIPANGKVEIELSYDQLLQEVGGAIEFQYPLATERLNRAPIEQVLVEILYKGDLPLKSVYSPSHRVDVARTGETTARVTYERGNSRPASNIQVYFGRAKEELGITVLSHRPAGEPGTFLAAIGCDTAIRPTQVVRRDVIYALDTSGSMGGEKMTQAKSALNDAIGMLRRNDRFGIVAFANDLEHRARLISVQQTVGGLDDCDHAARAGIHRHDGATTRPEAVPAGPGDRQVASRCAGSHDQIGKSWRRAHADAGDHHTGEPGRRRNLHCSGR